jgi:hypothetical protein
MIDTTDETMDAITRAVERGRAGDADAARSALVDLWAAIGAEGDALHRCTLAHYLADLYDDPAQALMWDVRALDAADALDDARVQQYHASLAVRGFYPSLHLNLADNLRLLGSFDAARTHLDAAAGHLDALGDDAYGRMIHGALDDVGAAIDSGSTERRAPAV